MIYLAKADAFNALVPNFGALLAPPDVWFEAVEEGERIGAPEVTLIRKAHDQGIVRQVALKAAEAKQAKGLRARGLGRGESEVLVFGVRTGSVVIDEGKGSRVARELGLQVVSVLQIPVIHFGSGHVSQGEAIEWSRRLAEVMNVKAEVLTAIERRLTR